MINNKVLFSMNFLYVNELQFCVLNHLDKPALKEICFFLLSKHSVVEY